MRLKADVFVEKARETPVLDVRSPAEYAQGHMPGAISFPLFDDDERAEVGTLYKQVGQREAMERGMELIGPKVGAMFKQGIAHAREGRILVYCWRGGQRSASVGALLGMAGLQVGVLEGGYKAYRNWTLDQFKRPWPLAIIGGMTGSGKTEVLHRLRDLGENILDLEHLADHRGSAFGRLGATRTVTPMQFENDIAWALTALPPGRIWVEDESRTLGSLQVPTDFWRQMEACPVYALDVAQDIRSQRLMVDYGQFPRADLEAAAHKIARRLGGQRLQQVVSAIEAEDAETVIAVLLDYYDRAYQHFLAERTNATIVPVEVAHYDVAAIARDLVARTQEK
jgi:tRNA 2-selenouridine synthase